MRFDTCSKYVKHDNKYFLPKFYLIIAARIHFDLLNPSPTTFFSFNAQKSLQNPVRKIAEQRKQNGSRYLLRFKGGETKIQGRVLAFKPLILLIC